MAIQDISIADKTTLDAVNTKVGSFMTAVITTVLAERATEDSITWALKQSGFGKALDSLAGLGNSTLQGCDTFAEVLSNSTARGLLINTPALLETVLLTEYGANAIVNNTSCMSAIGASSTLRAKVLQYEYFVSEVFDAASVLADIIASSNWRTSIINNPTAFRVFFGNSTFFNNVMSSSADFAQIAANAEAMAIVCESSAGRTAMYSNYSVTESLIAASETALAVISGLSSKIYAPSTGTGVVVFNYPVFILNKYCQTTDHVTANTTTFADDTTNTTNVAATVTTLNRFADNQIVTTVAATYFYVTVFII